MFIQRITTTAICLLLALATVNAQTVWGTGNSRTEQRDNAGLQGNAGAISGFYETPTAQNAGSNYPIGADSWWHMIDVRHSNPANNYAMQFAGSFFNQELYFRKTNGNGSQVWKRVVMGDYGTLGNSIGNTLELLGVDASSAGNQSHLKILLKRHTNGTTWENASTRIQAVTDASLQAYIDFNPKGNQHGLALGVNDQEHFRMLSNGNVGIGTATPGIYKLAVEGTIGARKVRVTQLAWADYVFEPTYQLLSLQQVEAFIKRYKHLPEVPSAKEVEENGIDIGENQTILLKKIEELTLYMIEQNKKLGTLQKEMDLLKNAIRK